VTESIRALEQFVVDSDDLLALEARIGKFNIFDALGIAEVEIRHSNFLAFILDPAESHGLGQLFLKAFVMDLLKAAPAQLRPLSPIHLDGADLPKIEVKREWENMDILVASEQPPFNIVIENKVRSREHSDQLTRYRRTVNTLYPGRPTLYVYLTQEGEEASDDNWVSYSYAHLHRVLSRVRQTHHSAIGEDVLLFLDHYLNLIGSRFMDDAEIDELCRRIYKNHRQALDLIFERVGRLGSRVLDEVEAILLEDSRWHLFYRGRNTVDFVPKDWLEWLPNWGIDRRDQPRAWLILRFDLGEQKLDYYVEVRRMADLQKRRDIINTLIENAAQFGFKRMAGSISDSYTRVSGRERILKWTDEQDPDEDAIRAAVTKKLDMAFSNLKGIATALKPLLA
jgi:hypothetical protein